MILDEARPGSPDVGRCADEEQNHDDHTVETEEGTLNNKISTIELHALLIKLNIINQLHQSSSSINSSSTYDD
jgi:hypothetical protein